MTTERLEERVSRGDPIPIGAGRPPHGRSTDGDSGPPMVDTSNLVGSHSVVGRGRPRRLKRVLEGGDRFRVIGTYGAASCRKRAMVSGTSRRSCARARRSISISKLSVLVASPSRSGRWPESAPHQHSAAGVPPDRHLLTGQRSSHAARDRRAAGATRRRR